MLGDATDCFTKLDLGDLTDLSRRGLVIHPVIDEEHVKPTIHISHCGEFCRIVPTSFGCKSIRKLTLSIDYIESKYLVKSSISYNLYCPTFLFPISGFKTIRFLTVCVSEPLVPYAKKTVKGRRWEAAGPFSKREGEDLVVNFLSRLCKWQRSNPARDCQILSTLDIPHPLLLLISIKNSSRELRHLILTNSLRSTNTSIYMSPEQIVLRDAITIETKQLVSSVSKNSVVVIPPRMEFYPNVFGENEQDIAVTYVVDVVLRPLETVKSNPFHDVIVKCILSDVDRVDITLGPVRLH